MIKRVSFKEYQILKAIYKNITVITADDTSATIKVNGGK